eukprot:TRINITY_DN15700_c0_g1_i1.p1 TRINITY_DN15700_c0_g1~~TRINITY_DN15700_c0_g1_i1.p1  ORF type:complete len:156 (-),score=41.45 TRINITY_DN15700_c0_g1_i1:16-483(-)
MCLVSTGWTSGYYPSTDQYWHFVIDRHEVDDGDDDDTGIEDDAKYGSDEKEELEEQRKLEVTHIECTRIELLGLLQDVPKGWTLIQSAIEGQMTCSKYDSKLREEKQKQLAVQWIEDGKEKVLEIRQRQAERKEQKRERKEHQKKKTVLMKKQVK